MNYWEVLVSNNNIRVIVKQETKQNKQKRNETKRDTTETK